MKQKGVLPNPGRPDRTSWIWQRLFVGERKGVNPSIITNQLANGGLGVGMPRALCTEFDGAIYHVMSWGSHLDPIFRDANDRQLPLKTLGETG